MPAARTLLDSRNRSDARLMGYDGAVDPAETSDGLIVATDDHPTIPTVTLQGPDGCVELTGRAQVLAVAEALNRALGTVATLRLARAS